VRTQEGRNPFLVEPDERDERGFWHSGGKLIAGTYFSVSSDPVNWLAQVFTKPAPVIGVVHLLPLPGSPRWGGSLTQVLARAEQEATALATGGADGIILENFNDAPFTKGQVDPAVVSAMSLAVRRVRQLTHLPIGINVLRNDAYSAMAIACCTEAAFIRVNVLTGVTVTDQGLIEGCAHELLRYRRHLGCDVKILADVYVKHGMPLAPVGLVQQAQETIERGLADGIILSGPMTGHPPAVSDLQAIHKIAPGVPVFIGSGATPENIGQLLPWCDGVIVASALKRHGQPQQAIDPIRVQRFVETAQHVLHPEAVESLPSE